MGACLCGAKEFSAVRGRPRLEKCRICGGQRVAKAKIADVEARGNQWLADANEAAESGNATKADECYRKGQYWLDKLNRMVNAA